MLKLNNIMLFIIVLGNAAATVKEVIGTHAEKCLNRRKIFKLYRYFKEGWQFIASDAWMVHLRRSTRSFYLCRLNYE
jgi:hypothetical protein